MVVFLLIATALGTYALLKHYYSSDQKTKRAIQSAPRTSIAEARAGTIAKLVGRVQYLAPPVEAPLSGRLCAFYSAVIEEYESHGRSGSWRPIASEETGVDFLIDDGTGKARVINRQLKVFAVADHQHESGLLFAAPPRQEAFLQKYNKTSHGRFFNKTLRSREAIFEAGEEIAIVGLIGFEPDLDAPTAGQYRDAPKRVTIEAPAIDLLLASDHPRVTRS